MKEDLPLSAVHDTDKFLGVSTVVIEQDSVDITSKKVIEDVLQTSEAIRFDESSVSFNPETVYHSILRPLSWRIPQQQSTVLEEWYCAVTL